MGESMSPGRRPYRLRQCEVRSLVQAGLEGVGARRLAVAHSGAATAVPARQQAKVNLVVIVPAKRTKRGRDLLPSQNFRQLSLWGPRLDHCRHQARKPGRAKKRIGRLHSLMLKSWFRGFAIHLTGMTSVCGSRPGTVLRNAEIRWPCRTFLPSILFPLEEPSRSTTSTYLLPPPPPQVRQVSTQSQNPLG